MGYGNVAVFINRAQGAKVKALSDFVAVEDMNIAYGVNADTPINIPVMVGRVIGRIDGCWVSEWEWMPANYMLGINLDAPAPLKMRVDSAESGLPAGLQLVSVNQVYPFQQSFYRNRFGMGVGNRLNGVAMELTADATYDIPTLYA
jgi:hypothetical protein